MTGIRIVPRERYGAPFVELRTREFLCSDRGAMFSCCALVQVKPGEALGLARTNPHRGGSK
jgi:hypothetical protein